MRNDSHLEESKGIFTSLYRFGEFAPPALSNYCARVRHTVGARILQSEMCRDGPAVFLYT